MLRNVPAYKTIVIGRDESVPANSPCIVAPRYPNKLNTWMARNACLCADLLTKVELDRHHQEGIKTDDAKSHPERTIRASEGDQNLQEGKRQEFVEQQDADV